MFNDFPNKSPPAAERINMKEIVCTAHDRWGVIAIAVGGYL